MKYPTTHNLLRRTAVALAAIAASLASVSALAGAVTFSSGETCPYSGMAVDPAGNVSVTCSSPATGGGIGTTSSTGGGTTTGSTGTPTVYISNATTQLPLSAAADGVNGDAPASSAVPTPVYMVRTNSSTGDIVVNYNISGTGCWVNGFPPPATGAVTLSGTSLQSQSIGLVATYPGSICSIGIISIAPAASGTVPVLTVQGATGAQQPNHVDIPVSLTLGGGSSTGSTGGTGGTGGTTSGGSVPSVSGCPAPDPTTAMYTFPTVPGQHVNNNTFGSFVLPSGAIGSLPLPATINGHASAQVQLTYSVYTASTQTNVEISVSRCPGVIDPTGALTGMNPAVCYFASFTSADATVDWYGKLVDGVTSASTGKCMALETGQPGSNGPYYANIRYTYTSAGCPYGTCGEMLQWNDRTP